MAWNWGKRHYTDIKSYPLGMRRSSLPGFSALTLPHNHASPWHCHGWERISKPGRQQRPWMGWDGIWRPRRQSRRCWSVSACMKNGHRLAHAHVGGCRAVIGRSPHWPAPSKRGTSDAGALELPLLSCRFSFLLLSPACPPAGPGLGWAGTRPVMSFDTVGALRSSCGSQSQSYLRQ
jgi:hypothetical protein